jgi:hypothetical protein
VNAWVGKGARPSDTVAKLIKLAETRPAAAAPEPVAAAPASPKPTRARKAAAKPAAGAAE